MQHTMILPGRLMVGHMTLDHGVKVRVLPGQYFLHELVIYGEIGK